MYVLIEMLSTTSPTYFCTDSLAIILFRIVQYWTATPGESAQNENQRAGVSTHERKARLEGRYGALCS